MITGSCLCGTIKYEADETQAGDALHCHCKDCQKVTGSGKATVVLFPQNAVTIEGAYKTYHKIGTDGSHVGRAFCPDCGSQLFTFVQEIEGSVFIKAGTMNEADWVAPIANCWTKSARSFSPVSDGGVNFDANPIAEED